MDFQQPDDLPEDAKPVFEEILKIKAAGEVSLNNAELYKSKLKEQQKAVEKAKQEKDYLLKEVIQNQCELTEGKYQHTVIEKGINKAREIAKRINNYAERNKNIMETCSEDFQAAQLKISENKAKMSQNILGFEQSLIRKRNGVACLKETLAKQRQEHREDLENKNKNTHEFCNELKALKTKTSTLKTDYKEFMVINDQQTMNNAETQHKKIQLDIMFNEKQQRKKELEAQMETDRQIFNQTMEEMLNLKMERNTRKRELEIKTDSLENGIKNQNEYNKVLESKNASKAQKIENIKIQNAELKTKFDKKYLDLTNQKKDKQELLSLKLAELEQLKGAVQNDNENLKTLENELHIANQHNEDLGSEVQSYQTRVTQLEKKNKYEEEEMRILENESLRLVSSESHQLKANQEEWQQKLEKRDAERKKEMSDKVTQIKSIKEETEQVNIKTKDLKDDILNQINLVMRNFDKQTEEKSKIFEEEKKEWQKQLDLIEIETSNVRNKGVVLEEQVEKLEKECCDIELSVKNKESQQAFTNSPPIKITSSLGAPIFTLPKPPISRRAIDELSGSSAEGNAATYQQMVAYRRKIEKKRQAKHKRQ